MKHLAVALLTLLITLSLQAQPFFGIMAGPQMTTVRYDIKSARMQSTARYGFTAGAFMKVPFEGNLYFAPAAFYSYKGYKVNLTVPSFPPDLLATDNDVRLHTFELSPLLQVDFSGKPEHLFVRFGPSFDFQLLGRESFNKTGGDRVERNMKFGFADYGRYSVNAMGQLGYETAGGWVLTAQYSYGLTSINNADEGPRIRHRVLGITVGKLLKKEKVVIDTRNRQ